MMFYLLVLGEDFAWVSVLDTTEVLSLFFQKPLVNVTNPPQIYTLDYFTLHHLTSIYQLFNLLKRDDFL